MSPSHVQTQMNPRSRDTQDYPHSTKSLVLWSWWKVWNVSMWGREWSLSLLFNFNTLYISTAMHDPNKWCKKCQVSHVCPDAQCHQDIIPRFRILNRKALCVQSWHIKNWWNMWHTLINAEVHISDLKTHPYISKICCSRHKTTEHKSEYNHNLVNSTHSISENEIRHQDQREALECFPLLFASMPRPLGIQR